MGNWGGNLLNVQSDTKTNCNKNISFIKFHNLELQKKYQSKLFVRKALFIQLSEEKLINRLT